MLLSLLIPMLALASPTPAEIKEDLHQLRDIVAADYGPLPEKRARFGLNLGRLTTRYEEKILTANPAELPYLLLKFVAEFRDSHFGAAVPGTRRARLGFTTDLIAGHVLIAGVDRALLPRSIFPFDRGDEILRFNGRPVNEEVEELKTYRGMGRDITARTLAVYRLADREETSLPWPTGKASVTVRSSGETHTLELPWVEGDGPAANHCPEASRIAPPAGAKVVSDVPFTAFTFAGPRGNLGFLRIPDYYPVDLARGKEIAAARFAQYERVVAQFERETTGLVIDQTYNCGGSILYLHKILSLFVREPFAPITMRFRASAGQESGLRSHLAKQVTTSDGFADFTGLVNSIARAGVAGRPYTPRLPVFGFMEVALSLPKIGTLVAPNPVGYTKPIVVLINEMSGSGGDVFPAMMQDLGRARLLGTATMGGGGHTWDQPELRLKNSGVKLGLTRSLIYRPNGRLIENVGAEPDRPYAIGPADFFGGYRNYLEEAARELD